MKNFYVLLIISVAFVACSSKPKPPLPLSPEDERIRTVIGIVNSKIHAEYGNMHKNKFAKFDATSYQALLNKNKSAQAQQLRELLPLFEIQEFTATPKTFIFCGFAPKLSIAFCDDAACPGAEFYERSNSAAVLVEKGRVGLPLKKCLK